MGDGLFDGFVNFVTDDIWPALEQAADLFDDTMEDLVGTGGFDLLKGAALGGMTAAITGGDTEDILKGAGLGAGGALLVDWLNGDEQQQQSDVSEEVKDVESVPPTIEVEPGTGNLSRLEVKSPAEQPETGGLLDDVKGMWDSLDGKEKSQIIASGVGGAAQWYLGKEQTEALEKMKERDYQEQRDARTRKFNAANPVVAKATLDPSYRGTA